MFHGMFPPSNNALSLACFEAGMGKGYCAWNEIIELVLARASTFRTTKRCAWFPMTFGQVLMKNDKRMSIEETGVIK